MAKYKEIKMFSPDDLDFLCERNKWYTAGNQNDYSILRTKVKDIFDNCEDTGITLDRMAEVAEDICRHSKRGLEATWVLQQMNNECGIYFVKE